MDGEVLFPAQAGVILRSMLLFFIGFTVPRASGGDPDVLLATKSKNGCSPRKRG